MSPMCRGMQRAPRARMRGVNSAKTEGRRVAALEERKVEFMAESVPSFPSRFLVRTFYQFTPLEPIRLSELATCYHSLGRKLGISGAVILAPEGINSSIAGPAQEVMDFFQRLELDFPGLCPQDSWSQVAPFKRWRVLRRPRLVPSFECPTANFEKQKTPSEWDQIRRLVRSGKAQMIDVRNTYEIQIGTFPEALNPETASYQEFAKYLERETGHSLDPKLPTAIFCTGGIRCEKARLELEARGFSEVWSLKGGILNYLKEEGREGFQGECFVFDLRVALDRHLSPTTQYKPCVFCGGATPKQGERHLCTRRKVSRERRKAEI